VLFQFRAIGGFKFIFALLSKRVSCRHNRGVGLTGCRRRHDMIIIQILVMRKTRRGGERTSREAVLYREHSHLERQRCKLLLRREWKNKVTKMNSRSWMCSCSLYIYSPQYVLAAPWPSRLCLVGQVIPWC
jgi:hypothetical protein